MSLGVNAYGSSAGSLAQLFAPSTGFWGLAGSVVQPIFDGGTLKHRQGAAQAAYDQAAAQYRGTVLNAFQNVADALQAIEHDAVAMRAAVDAQRAAATSLAIARRQLSLGDISTLTLLGVEQADQQARLNLLQARANRLADTVGDYAAMNSVWDEWVPQGHTPARSTIGAKLIRPEYRVEIEVTAVAQAIGHDRIKDADSHA